MRKNVSFRFAILGLIVIPVLLGLAIAIAFAGAATGLDDLNYTEQEGWRYLDPGITVTSSLDDFSNGYIDIDLSNTTTSDQLRIVSSGPLSITGNAVLWNGNRIGTIDFIRNGQNGQPLRISFDATLPNADFETGDLTGWTVDNTQNQMMGQSWAEGPLVGTQDSDPAFDDQTSGSCSATVESAAAYQGSWGLKLDITGGVHEGYGTGHCPSITSSAFSAQAGDNLSLNWLAAQTSDYYDVFGFVENQDTGALQRLFHDTGSTTSGWVTLNTTISSSVCPSGTCNNLHFKFINGTYDQTGGLAIGSYLYIDGISVQVSAVATDAIVEYILEHIEYQNTSDNPLPAKPYTLTLVDASPSTGTSNATIFITAVNDPPTDITLSNSNIDENQPIGTVVGNFSTTDLDIGDTYTYTLVSGAGDTDNSFFTIVGGQLQAAESFDFESKSSYSLRVRSTDAGGLWTEKIFTVSINNVDDPPTITPSGADPTYFEGDPAVIVDSGITINDADSLIVSAVTVSISNNFISTEDLLEFPAGGVNGITGSYNGGTGVLTLTGSGSETAADYQAAFRAVRYRNSNNLDPSELDRTVEFNLTGAYGPVTAGVIVHVRNMYDADLALTKTQTAPAGPVNAGQQVTYQIMVDNNGPDAAQNVQVVEAIPAGTTVVDIIPSSGQCSLGGICTLGSIPNGGSATVAVTLLVDAGYSGNSITNQASVSADEEDPSSADNSASASTTVNQSADLSLSKVDLNDPVAPTEGLLYEIVVTNNGPSDAQGVVVTDTLDANVTFTGATPGCSELGGTVTCDLGAMVAGETATFLIAVTVGDIPSGTTLQNTASVRSFTTDPNAANNSSSEQTTVQNQPGPMADLNIVKTGDTSVNAGEQATFAITVTNAGPQPATNVGVEELIPYGTSIAAMSAQNPNDSGEFCSLGGSCFLGSIPSGSSASINLTLDVAADFGGSSFINQAHAAADQYDGNMADNIAAAEVTSVQKSADLSVDKTGSSSATSGEAMSYTIVVTNNGPSDAQNVVLTDTLPIELENVAATAVNQPNACSIANGTLTCDLGTLAPGDSVTVDVTAEVKSDVTASTISNTANVSSETPDPVDTNNADGHVTDINLSADLEILKSATATVISGQNITYGLKVMNHGPSVAANVIITDPLPSGVSWVSGCDESLGTVTCDAGALAMGESATFTVTATTDPGFAPGTSIQNTATASSSTPDNNSLNNTDSADTSVVSQADLSLAKSGPASVIAGENIQYTIVVSNSGPSVAHNVVVVDDLPAGVSLTGAAASNGGTCSGGTCQLGDLAVLQTVTITMDGFVISDYQGSDLTNTATVFTDSDDPVAPNNSSSANTQVSTEADLEVVKNDLSDPVGPTEGFLYEIAVTNHGPSDATNVTITDTLGANLTFAATSPGCSGNVSSPVVNCSLNDLASGATAKFLIAAIVADVPSGTILNNDVIVESDTFDPNGENNSDSESTTVRQNLGTSADLSITKSASPDPVTAGELVTYSLTIENNGPGLATNVQVLEMIPGGASVESIKADNPDSNFEFCTLSGVCYLGMVTPVTTATVETVLRVDSGFSEASITNMASVSADQPDPDPADNVTSATVNVNTAASLRITKTDLNDPVISGDPIDYQILLTNDGPSDAYNIVVTDTIPANTVFAGASDSCSEANGLLSCNLAAIPAGDTASILLRVITNNALSPGTIITNTAYANADNAQEVSATAETLVAQTPLNPTDLSISLADDPDPVVAGEILTYTVTVINNGPAPATSVLVVDFLPNGLELLQTLPSQGLCQIDLTCSLGDLGIGGSATVVYVAKVKSDQLDPLTNVVRVSASNPDLDLGNNEASTTTQVTTEADLLIEKTVTPDIVTPGGNLTYEIFVTNRGPSDAQNVVVTDTLPVELTSASYNVSQGSCANDVCTLGRIAVGESASVVILASISPDVTQPFTNTAEVGTSTPNLNPIASADAVAQVVGGTDLALQKMAPATAYAGESITYTVVLYHLGLSDAQNVVMTDVLPEGVVFNSASPACSHNNGTVTCTETTLPAGVIVSYDIVVTVDEGLEPGTSLENTADVDSDTFDRNMANNRDTADTSIVRKIDLVLSKSGPATTIPGSQLVYSIIVTNTGPSVARSVDIKDELPENLTLEDVTVERSGEGNMACVDLLCQVGDVAVDEIITMIVTATLPADYMGTEFTNKATVFTDSPDLDQANNSDIQRTMIYKMYFPVIYLK